MLEYLPYFFGVTFFLFGLYLFLISFKFYIPKYKSEVQKARYEKTLEKFGTFLKISSLVLMTSGAYDLITRDIERYRIVDVNKESEWTIKDKENLVKNCISETGQTGIDYPEITADYCNCSIEKIMNSMTRAEYRENLSKPKEEKLKEILPIVQSCVDLLKLRIDSIARQSN
jgi:ATP-dependent Lon protease